MTIWGALSDKCDFNVGDLMAIKAARCSEFGGRSLNVAEDHASLFRESDFSHPHAKKVKEWHKTLLAQNNGDCSELFSNFESLT